MNWRTERRNRRREGGTEGRWNWRTERRNKRRGNCTTGRRNIGSWRWKLRDGKEGYRDVGTREKRGRTEGRVNWRTERRDRGALELENGEKEQKEG